MTARANEILPDAQEARFLAQHRKIEVNHAAWQEARDVRKGLKYCALPTCGAREPHANSFKTCPCEAVVYCSKAHQKEHWKVHKRDHKLVCESTERKVEAN